MFKYRSTNVDKSTELIQKVNDGESENAVDVIPTVSKTNRGLMDPSMLDIVENAETVDSDVEIDSMLSTIDLEMLEEYKTVASLDECFTVEQAIKINNNLATEKINSTDPIPEDIVRRLTMLPGVITTTVETNKDYIYGKEIYTLRNTSPWRSIHIGWTNLKILSFDDDIVSFGGNAYGDRGLGNVDEANNPKALKAEQTNSNSKIKQLVTCDSAMFVLYDDNTLWYCGGNAYGVSGLGHDTRVNKLTKVPLYLTSKIKKVEVRVTGDRYTSLSAILLENGDLFFAGYNGHGQFGVGRTGDESTFTKSDTSTIPGKVVDIYLGNGYNGCWSYAINDRNELYFCGYNGWSGAFDSTTTNSSVWRKTTIPNNEKVRFICSKHRVHWLITDKNIYCCGMNDTGALGDGTTTDRYSTLLKRTDLPFTANEIRKIDISYNLTNGRDYPATYVLLNNGDLYTAGYNGYGQTGTTGDDSSRLRFQKVNINGNVEPIMDIACGINSSYLMTISGRIYSAGDDAGWRLGFNEITGYGDTTFYTEVPQAYLCDAIDAPLHQTKITNTLDKISERLWPKYMVDGGNRYVHTR